MHHQNSDIGLPCYKHRHCRHRLQVFHHHIDSLYPKSLPWCRHRHRRRLYQSRRHQNSDIDLLHYRHRHYHRRRQEFRRHIDNRCPRFHPSYRHLHRHKLYRSMHHRNLGIDLHRYKYHRYHHLEEASRLNRYNPYHKFHLLYTDLHHHRPYQSSNHQN